MDAPTFPGEDEWRLPQVVDPQSGLRLLLANFLWTVVSENRIEGEALETKTPFYLASGECLTCETEADNFCVDIGARYVQIRCAGFMCSA